MESIGNITTFKSEEQLRKEVGPIYLEIIEKPEIAEALELLNNLSPELVYHSKNHTLEVIKETILFALADGASRETIEEQAIAAAWHDVGFLKKKGQNETIAVDMFKSSKAFKTFPKETSDEVVANILDTQMVLTATGLSFTSERSVNKYILDADIGNFGRTDFFEKFSLLAKEAGLDLSNNGTKRNFMESTIKLLRNHKWYTESAQALRQDQKEANLRMLEEELNALPI